MYRVDLLVSTRVSEYLQPRARPNGKPYVAGAPKYLSNYAKSLSTRSMASYLGT